MPSSCPGDADNVARRCDILDSEAASRMSQELVEFVLDLERKRKAMELVDGEGADDDDDDEEGWKIYNKMKEAAVANKVEREKDDIDAEEAKSKIEVPYYITMLEQVIIRIIVFTFNN